VSPKFFMKAPVFMLEGGVRALLVYAKIDPLTPNTVQAILHRTDGKQIGLAMDIGRATRAQRNGPFVLLAEVEGTAGHIRPGTIIGLDGQPLNG
jgi:hypothetical protein